MKPFNILKKNSKKLLGATGGGLNFHAEVPALVCVFGVCVFFRVENLDESLGGRNEKFFSQKVELKEHDDIGPETNMTSHLKMDGKGR